MEYAGCSAGIGYALLLFRTDSIGAYAIGVTRQRLSGRHPLVNPTLITIGIVAAALIGFLRVL